MSQDHTIPNPLNDYIPPTALLEDFQQCLGSAQAGQLSLFSVRGHEGSGKTVLLSYLAEHVCPHYQWQPVHIHCGQSGFHFRTILAALDEALESHVPSQSLLQYRAALEPLLPGYQQRRAELARQKMDTATPQANKNTIDFRLWMEAVQLRVAQRVPQCDLAMTSRTPLCFLIDDYEFMAQTDLELVGWFWQSFLDELVRRVPYPVVVVTCGTVASAGDASNHMQVIDPVIQEVDLVDFDRSQVRSYLDKKGLLTARATQEEDKFVSICHTITQGMPLSLVLLVRYLTTLVHEEQADPYQQVRALAQGEPMHLKSLLEQILARLPEPQRTMLERGPILRSFNRKAYQALLQGQNTSSPAPKIDEQTYRHFLTYPFFSRSSEILSDRLATPPTFHSLVRRQLMSTLRMQHPKLYADCQRTMAMYYAERISAVAEQGNDSSTKKGLFGRLRSDIQSKEQERERVVSLRDKADVADDVFSAIVEYLYHALQVQELQEEAFAQWRLLVERMKEGGYSLRIGQLWEVVRQLMAEDEPFFQKSRAVQGMDAHGKPQLSPYDQYQSLYSDALRHHARTLNQFATMILEQKQDASNDDLGVALSHLKRAASLFERLQDTATLAIVLNNCGGVYRRWGQVKAALVSYEEGLSLNEASGGDLRNSASMLDNIAFAYRELGQGEEALQAYERALALREQVKDRSSQIVATLHDIGTLYQKQGKLDEALHYFERLLPISEQVNKPSETVSYLQHAASISQEKGDLDKAVDFFQRALHLHEQEEDTSGMVSCLSNISNIYMMQGKVELARQFGERSLALGQTGGDRINKAVVLLNTGYLAEQRGKMQEALDYYEQARAISERLEDHRVLVDALVQSGRAYLAQGELVLARQYFERALAASQKSKQDEQIARSLRMLGAVSLARRDTQQALSYYEQALTIIEKTGQRDDLIDMFHEMGSFYAHQRKPEQALDYYQRSLALAEQGGKPAQLARSFHALAGAYGMQQHYEEAVSYFERALALEEQIGNPVTIFQTLNNLSFIYAEQKHYEQAMSLLKRSLDLVEPTGNPEHIALVLNNLAGLSQEREEFEQALGYAERALAYSEQTGKPYPVAMCLNNLGGMYRKLEQWHKAIELHARCLALAERLGDPFKKLQFQQCECLVTCYEALGEQEKSTEYRLRAEQLKEQ